MFFTIHLAPNIMIGLTGVLLNPNILCNNIPLTGECATQKLKKKLQFYYGHVYIIWSY